MSQKENNQLKDHEYDGIQEYDNNLPKWWLTTFYITIVFALFYWVYYEIYELAPNPDQEYIAALAQHDKKHKKEIQISDSMILEAAKDVNNINSGKKIFMQNCASCHGNQGQGGIGANLIDSYWLHGAKPNEIFKTIQKGVAAKSMPAWENSLSPKKIINVVSFILSLKGKVVPGAKKAEGKLIE